MEDLVELKFPCFLLVVDETAAFVFGDLDGNGLREVRDKEKELLG